MISLHNWLLLAIVICIQCCTELATGRKSYHGYSVYQFLPQKKDHLDDLYWLLDETVNNLKSFDLQFWSRPGQLNETVEVLVGPRDRSKLEEWIISNRWSMPSRVTIPNVGQLIDRENSCHWGGHSSTTTTRQIARDDGFYASYHSYASIEKRISELAKQSSPVNVDSSVIGRSTEGRNLYLVKVSSEPGANRPVIFIDAAHHAREWIAVSTSIYLLESLANRNVAKFSYEWKIELDLDRFDYWFLPVINPDGYEFSRNYDRMWRKTRSPPVLQGNFRCRRRGQSTGVDPNRNYPFYWRGTGSSRDPCSEIYAGESPLSEPETKTLAQTLQANKDRIKMYISLHSYAQKFLIPWGYERRWANRYRDLQKIGAAFVAAVYAFRLQQYDYGNTATLMGPAAGASDDYAQSLGIGLSCTLELPDKGTFGFIMPPTYILAIGQETLIGLRAITDTILTLGN